MKNVDEFIEEYKKLEEAVRRVYHLTPQDSVVSALKREKRFEKYKSGIQSCADLRNFYQHDSKLKNRYIADVSVEAIDFVRLLTTLVNNRGKCKDQCIKLKDVYWRSLNDPVRETMSVMRDNLYTHIPILEDGKVIGVFDENSLFSFIASDTEGIFEFDDNLTFADMKDYIKLDNREMEEFKFFGMNRYIDDASKEFNKSFSQGKRLGLLLLNVNGKPSEPLQGILTPWDIIGN